MKIAILFFGLSKYNYNNYNARNLKEITVDYEKSYDNYKRFIFDFFKKKGYDIDVYFTTNILEDKDRESIIEKYKPIDCNFIDNADTRRKSRNIKLNDVINLCLKSSIKYDLILITRFDLLFQKDFNKSNIIFDKFNLVSVLENPKLICDNFYLFPYKYLELFSSIVKSNLHKSFHNIRKDLYKKVKKNCINYILNEKCKIYKLSFYKIHHLRNSIINLRFMHIPHTGGKFIENAAIKKDLLWGRFDKDLKSSNFQISPWHFPQRMKTYSFCVIREPFIRFISQFYYENTVENYNSKRLNEFIKKIIPVITNNINYNNNHYLPQYKYCKECDIIILYDNLQDNLNKTTDLFNFEPIILEKFQDIPRRLSQADISLENKSMIREIYQLDFELYNSVRENGGVLNKII